MSWAAGHECYPKASLEVLGDSPTVQTHAQPTPSHHHPQQIPLSPWENNPQSPSNPHRWDRQTSTDCHSAFTLEKPDLAKLPALRCSWSLQSCLKFYDSGSKQAVWRGKQAAQPLKAACKAQQHGANHGFLSQALPVNSQQNYFTKGLSDGSRICLQTLSPLVHEHSTKCNKPLCKP